MPMKQSVHKETKAKGNKRKIHRQPRTAPSEHIAELALKYHRWDRLNLPLNKRKAKPSKQHISRNVLLFSSPSTKNLRRWAMAHAPFEPSANRQNKAGSPTKRANAPW